MKLTVGVLGIIVGVMFLIWSMHLMHGVYSSNIDLLIMMKIGSVELSSAAHEENASEAAKTLFVHVSLVVLGVILLMGSAFAIWSASRRR